MRELFGVVIMCCALIACVLAGRQCAKDGAEAYWEAREKRTEKVSEQIIIDHGAGRYNPTNGMFEWTQWGGAR